jgi:superfamily II DNA or RNA helicase
LDKEKYTSKLIIITTYDSFCLNDEKILNSLDIEHTLIIADEVHKFGAVSYQRKLPEKIKYRIGLSATPKRPYDEKGTSAIFDYFCPSENFYEFTIKDAIDADMLCHYDYHPILVSLTDFEMDDYEIISEKISRLSVIVNNSESVTKEEKESLEQLLNAPSAIRLTLLGTITEVKLEQSENA